MTISNTTLPNGAVGSSYSAMLTGTGGTPQYAFTVASGTMPSGLNLALSGAIGGVPGAGAVGTHTVTFRVTDSTGATGTKPLSITIGAAGSGSGGGGSGSGGGGSGIGGLGGGGGSGGGGCALSSTSGHAWLFLAGVALLAIGALRRRKVKA